MVLASYQVLQLVGLCMSARTVLSVEVSVLAQGRSR